MKIKSKFCPFWFWYGPLPVIVLLFMNPYMSNLFIFKTVLSLFLRINRLHAKLQGSYCRMKYLTVITFSFHFIVFIHSETFIPDVFFSSTSVHTDGSRRDLICLKGTIPVNYKGKGGLSNKNVGRSWIMLLSWLFLVFAMIPDKNWNV